MNELARIVEALLFLSPEPLTASELAEKYVTAGAPA